LLGQDINAKDGKAELGIPGLREMSHKQYRGGAGGADLVYLASAAGCSAALSKFHTYYILYKITW